MFIGLQGAPATFPIMMDRVLWDVSDYTAAYLDDIGIHSTTWERHLKHIREIMKKLHAAGLTANHEV